MFVYACMYIYTDYIYVISANAGNSVLLFLHVR